jgi:uncharacterized Zn-binding protein involved in type VI secretion
MRPAARLLDVHVCGILVHLGGPILPTCSTDTIIWGLPAARVTDKAYCLLGPPAAIVTGSSTVMINNLPAARLLDTTAHGGKIIAIGAPTVLIGG